MKVVRLIDNLDARDGGPPSGIRELDRVLRDRGHRVVTLAMDKSGQVVTPLGTDDIIVPSVRWLGRAFSIALVRRAFREARDADVVVMHGFYLWHNVVAWGLAIWHSVPLVLQPHGVFEPYQRESSKPVKWVFDLIVGQRIRRRTSIVAVASATEFEGITDLWPESKIRVVGIGIRSPTATSKTRAPHDPVVLLSLSRISPKKRIDVTLLAVALLREQGVNCLLKVAGAGDPGLVASLRKTAERLGIASHVIWVGHVAGRDKEELFSTADIFVLPSENENFAISVAEAMACGLPCVVTQAVALAPLISEGAGRVIAYPDGHLLAAELLDLLTHPTVYAECARRARSLAASRLSWDSVAERWEAAMQCSPQ